MRKYCQIKNRTIKYSLDVHKVKPNPMDVFGSKLKSIDGPGVNPKHMDVSRGNLKPMGVLRVNPKHMDVLRIKPKFMDAPGGKLAPVNVFGSKFTPMDVSKVEPKPMEFHIANNVSLSALTSLSPPHLPPRYLHRFAFRNASFTFRPLPSLLTITPSFFIIEQTMGKGPWGEGAISVHPNRVTLPSVRGDGAQSSITTFILLSAFCTGRDRYHGVLQRVHAAEKFVE